MLWTGQSRGPKWGVRTFINLIKIFGYWPAYILILPVSFIYYLRDKETKVALMEFRTQLGLTTSWFALWKHFFAYSMVYLHRTGFFKMGTRGFKVSVIGEQSIADALEKSGVIILSAHIGAWEIGGNLLVDRIHAPVNILAAERDMGPLADIDNELFRARRVSIINVDQDPLALTLTIRDALKNKEIVAALGDRSVSESSVVTTEFLGRKTQFPQGIFEIAMMYRVPVIPVFTLRTGLSSYTFIARDQILLKPKSRKERGEVLENAVKLYVKEVEKIAREYPEQWFNFFPFWGDETSKKTEEVSE